MFKKITLLILALSFVLSGFTACKNNDNEEGGETESEVLKVLGWDGYFDPAVTEAFEQETGMKIEFTSYAASIDEATDKLESSDCAGYDVVMLSDYVIEICRRKGFLRELDFERLPNYKNINPAYTKQYYDSENKYSVPFLYGCPLIVYNPKRPGLDTLINTEIKGYSDLIGTQLKGSIVAMDERRVMCGLMLKALGYSLNTSNASALSQLKATMKLLSPNIKALDSNDPMSILISGDASIGLLFNSQVAALVAAHPEFQVVYPEEGLGFGIDCFTIAKNTKNSLGAYKFIDYCLQPENSVKNSVYNGFSNCNMAATALFDDDYKNNKAINIPAELLAEAEIIRPLDTATDELYNEIWKEFKQ